MTLIVILSIALFFVIVGTVTPFEKPILELKRSTYKKVALHWCNTDYQCPPYWLVTLTKTSDTHMIRTCFFFVEGQTTQLCVPLILTAGSEYSASVAAISNAFVDTNVPSVVVFDEATVNFRAGASDCLIIFGL